MRAHHFEVVVGRGARFPLSGLYLWWPVKRMRIGGARWSSRFWYDLHSSIGFFSVIPALLLAGTGVVIGFEDQLTRLIDEVPNSRTLTEDQIRPSNRSRHALAKYLDQAVAIASAQLRGAVPYQVPQMPRSGGLYVIALDDLHNRVSGARNFISLDPSNGRVISENLSSGLTSRAHLMALNGSIHTGNIWECQAESLQHSPAFLSPSRELVACSYGCAGKEFYAR